MVRDDEPISAEFNGLACVFGIEDALDDDLAFPKIADPLEIGPGDCWVEVCRQPADIILQVRRLATIGGDIAEIMRSPEQADIEGPPRVRDGLQNTTLRAEAAGH